MKGQKLAAPVEDASAAVPDASPLVAQVAENDHERAAKAPISKAMEDEIYGVMGALLGLLEVLSIDARDPPSERQQKVLHDALRFGDMLRARVEALVTLFADDDDARFQRRPYALRRLVDHSVRAASWAAAERGVEIVLPAGEGWESQLLLIDAPRVDRALRAITDTLVAALGTEGQVVLSIDERPHSVQLLLEARCAQLTSPALLLSALLLSAWEHVFRLQEGSLRVDAQNLSVSIELPKVSSGEHG